MGLGERLRQLRGLLTLKEAAALAGISVSYLSDIERGRTEPTLRTLGKLARAYDTTIGVILFLVTFEDESPRHSAKDAQS